MIVWLIAAAILLGYAALFWLIITDERANRWEPPPGDGSYDAELDDWAERDGQL